MIRSAKVACASLLIGCTVIPALAQWTEQNVRLEPGWNAIHIEIDPLPERCEDIFASVPVESVWTWNRRFRSVQFLKNPDELLAEQPEWRTYFPTNHPQAFLNNLHILRGGRCYLVKMAEDAQPVELTLTGRAVLPSQEWYPDSYNLVGFPVADGSTLTFGEYFRPSPAHAGTRVHELGADGTWSEITDTGATPIERGRAYWVWCEGPSEYRGPLTVSMEGDGAIEFNDAVSTIEIVLRNAGRAARTCTLKLLPSAPPPPAEGVAGLAGPLRVDYRSISYEPLRMTWKPLSAQLDRTIEPGATRTVALDFRRDEMPRMADAQYQGLLEVRDAKGMRILVPLATAGMEVQADGAPLPRPGLWVGKVVLDGVSEVNGSSEPQPTSAPLVFRVIVHQDSNGVARLLSEATEVLVSVQGNSVAKILSDGHTMAQYPSAEVAARYSAVTYGFRGARTLGYASGSEQLSLTLALGYDDPLNPFKHLYHPDHNNLDNYRTPLGEGVESYTVTRAIVMTLSSTPVGGVSTVGWGDTVAGGTYAESVNGLYHSTLKTAGRFVLNHVSDIAILD